jgi:hypothetical protein
MGISERSANGISLSWSRAFELALLDQQKWFAFMTSQTYMPSLELILG